MRLLTPPATPSGVSPTLPLLLHQLHQAYHCHQRCCHRRCCCCGQSSNRSDHHRLYPRHRSSHHRSCPQHRSFRRRLCPKRRRCHRLLCRSRRSYRCRSSPTRQFLHQQQVGRTKSGQSVVRTDGTLERDEPMAAWRQEQEGRWHAMKRGQAGSREQAVSTGGNVCGGSELTAVACGVKSVRHPVLQPHHTSLSRSLSGIA